MDLPGFPEALVSLFLLSAYGWGRLCRAFCDARVFRYYSLTALVGLAALNAIGGLLNLLSWARSPVLLLLLLTGAALGGVDLYKRRPWRACFRRGANGGQGLASLANPLLPLGLVFVAGATACLTLVPTTVFDIADDFHTYVPRAVRMTQTGSVGGNAFDMSGLDSFGSQSFFHGFFLSGSDIRLLNAFDAVICFVLCLLLVAEVSLRWRLPWFVSVLAVGSVATINPQCVNISPLYSSALFIGALVICGAFLERSWGTGRVKRGFRPEMTVALIAATLVSLKLTVAFFAALYLVILYALGIARTADRRSLFTSAVVAGLVTVAITLPWALAHVPTLEQARRLGLAFSENATLAARYPSMAAHDIANLFTTNRLFNGDNPFSFHFLAGICFGIGLMSLFRSLRRPSCPQATGLGSLIAVGFAVPMVYLLDAHLFAAATAIRYSCPVLIGCTAIICVSYVRLVRAPPFPDVRRVALQMSVLMGIVILIFGATFLSRVGRAVEQRAILAYPVSRGDIELSMHAVSRNQALYFQSIQNRMEPGTTALVWIVAPFHLDFNRNRLFVVSLSGLISPGLHFPAGADLQSLENYLKQWGIRYVLVETR
ncbi:MAG TPA: hypothetical protein VK639_17170, partial [Terriglobales bacterium]|nr:hypothetical protein [Terriglobales bacterium]